MDPAAAFVPPQESRHSAASKRYPLELLARKPDNFLNSIFVNLPTHQKMEPQHDRLEISSEDAQCRGIHDGDWVRVFNERGEIFLRARINSTFTPVNPGTRVAGNSRTVQMGVVAARLGGGKLTGMGRNVNVLTSARLTAVGDGATFYSTLVEVEPAAATSHTDEG
jgi:anaerobic selenocysteine-containing dehydrogenase